MRVCAFGTQAPWHSECASAKETAEQGAEHDRNVFNQMVGWEFITFWAM